jgi:hypothetical protein
VEKKSEVITPNITGGVNVEETKTANIAELAPFEQKEAPEKQFERNEMKLIDEGIDRVKKDLTENVINPLKDKVTAARLEAEAENPTRGSIDEPEMKITAPDKKEINSAEKDIIDNMDLGALNDMDRFSIDDDDLKELEDDDEEPAAVDTTEVTEEEKEKQEQEKKEELARQEEIFKKYQSDIRDKIKPIKNDFDIKEFRISTKPISVTKALRKSTKETNTATWVLPNTNRLITLSGLSGEEIVNLNPENFENRMKAFRTAYSIMFNHLVDSNKPENMDTWLKSICGFDIDHIYFTAYKATFGKTNFITYECPECKNLELKEAKIEDMIVYPNDETKEKIQKLLETGEDTTPSILRPKLVPVSDDYAFSFHAPTVYGLIFETSALDETFTEKYADILSILAYIDNVYLIDKETHSFVPIDTNPDPDNVTKTVRRKVIAYYNIIKQLNSDQYGIVGAEITKINSNVKNNITYQIPEMDCSGKFKTGENCTHHYKAKAQNPLQLLFSRHQLAAIGNS